MTRAKQRAVFLDRDGVIVREVDYLTRVADMKVLPGSPEAIRKLRAAGFKAIVVSNQSAVARGMITLKGLSRLTRELKRRLLAKGAKLDAVYYCPHHPEAGRRIKCLCRKPGQLLIARAKRRFNVDLKRSFFIGDTTTDMLTAKRAGIPGLLVRTGYGGKDGSHSVKPKRTFKDLAAAANWILAHERA